MSGFLGRRDGDMTATLAAVAVLLKTLPLDAYREALADELRRARKAQWNPESLEVATTSRQARRVTLMAAIAAAREFIEAMEDAMQHNRAVARALESDDPELREGPPADHPAVVRALRPVRRTGSVLHDTFPGASVIPINRVEAITDDPA